ncbi:hypothetical protein I8748_24455 [Nostoc sp. CENA67]|uniref:Uncharacterized protein n=1 Tax=Amazonocrinis nigriterrae CENA67 TaxID=2794033 RepID=A0A8J7LD08_9NOST|nr:hypothetical protein [Amazonocrinis nigriterrae]MBH8565296.1 hypothetical protein [Amazonocrinis nigriterrae CENA67]
MKDNLTLIAAAAGGFMLSVALAGILRGTPITAWQEQSSFRSAVVTDLRITAKNTEDSQLFSAKIRKS